MRLTAITIPWADGEFTFDLRLGEVRKLQDMTGAGPPVILNRLMTDQYRVDDFRETILQGLIGGGTQVDKARSLVKKWVDDMPAAESLMTAQAILMAWMLGAPKGKTVAPETESETTTAPVGSTSTPSMETEPPSDSMLAA